MVLSFQRAPTRDREAGEAQERPRRGGSLPSWAQGIWISSKVQVPSPCSEESSKPVYLTLFSPGNPTQMPSDATIPYGFKESQSKAKRDVCQFWGDPAHRDFQKKSRKRGSPLVSSTAEQEESIKNGLFLFSVKTVWRWNGQLKLLQPALPGVP